MTNQTLAQIKNNRNEKMAAAFSNISQAREYWLAEIAWLDAKETFIQSRMQTAKFDGNAYRQAVEAMKNLSAKRWAAKKALVS